jgi:hypothetical protein
VQVHGEQLGKPKNLGFGDRGVDESTHVFGLPSQKGPEWGAPGWLSARRLPWFEGSAPRAA